ncbi:MAG: VOC family protein [Patescibacteria group bacterium]|nr:VOC family protein [Patescibacteria group bacterium]
MFRPVHFEIHCTDIDRAAKFYKALFGWKIEKWSEGDYWMVSTGEKTEDGINGGMMLRSGAPPKEGSTPNAFVCTSMVPSLDESMAAVALNGGKIALDKMAVKGMGWVAYGIDTEGNIFGMMQADKEAV